MCFLCRDIPLVILSVFFECFLIIMYTLFLVGFFFLFKDIDNPNISTFKTIDGTIMQLFQMTLGDFKVRTSFLFLLLVPQHTPFELINLL